MAKWIKTNGETIDVQPKNGTDYSLDELQGFVGGYIEIIGIDAKSIMVVNEEGRLNNLPVNEHASFLARMSIVGDVLVCLSKELK